MKYVGGQFALSLIYCALQQMRLSWKMHIFIIYISFMPSLGLNFNVCVPAHN